jgi:hypothetical protein
MPSVQFGHGSPPGVPHLHGGQWHPPQSTPVSLLSLIPLLQVLSNWQKNVQSSPGKHGMGLAIGFWSKSEMLIAQDGHTQGGAVKLLGQTLMECGSLWLNGMLPLHGIVQMHRSKGGSL